MSREGFRHDHFAEGSEALERAMLARGFTAIRRVETPSSTTNEPHDSDDHSSVSGEVGISTGFRCSSPGPGIGTWGKQLAEYYFVKSPLRLTAQRRYCRGLVAAHPIVHDDIEHHESVFAKHLKL